MAGIELINFDCDGVLVDSERIANEVFTRVLSEDCGWSLSLEEVIEIFLGHFSRQCMEIVSSCRAPNPRTAWSNAI